MAKMKKRMEKEEREQDLQTNWCFSLLQILVRWMNIKWHLHAAITASSELCLSLSCVTSVGISESDKDRRRNIVLNSRWRRHGRISFTRIRVPKLRRNTLSSMMSNTHTAEFNEICHFHLNFYTNLFHRWKIVRRRRKWKKYAELRDINLFHFYFGLQCIPFHFLYIWLTKEQNQIVSGGSSWATQIHLSHQEFQFFLSFKEWRRKWW